MHTAVKLPSPADTESVHAPPTGRVKRMEGVQGHPQDLSQKCASVEAVVRAGAKVLTAWRSVSHFTPAYP
jgi:hypothetical protein